MPVPPSHQDLTSTRAATTRQTAANPAKLASYLPLRTVRLSQAVPVEHALKRAPSLAHLAQLAEQSAAWLRLVAPLLPAALRAGIQAGPIQDQQWCLIAANSAVAAKLRQLSPALTAHLRSKGYAVQEIRIKIAMRSL